MTGRWWDGVNRDMVKGTQGIGWNFNISFVKCDFVDLGLWIWV